MIEYKIYFYINVTIACSSIIFKRAIDALI